MQKRLLALAGRRAKPDDHGHPDARVDGALHPAHAGRGGRRGQRDLRRHRRRDALPGDRRRTAPGAGGGDDGLASPSPTERELPYGRWLAERGPQANNQYHAIAFGAVGARLPARAQVHRLPHQHRHHRPADLGLPAQGAGAGALTAAATWCAAASCSGASSPVLHEEPLETIDLIEACADAARPRRPGQAGRQDRHHGGPAGRRAGRHEPVQGPHRRVSARPGSVAGAPRWRSRNARAFSMLPQLSMRAPAPGAVLRAVVEGPVARVARAGLQPLPVAALHRGRHDRHQPGDGAVHAAAPARARGRRPAGSPARAGPGTAVQAPRPASSTGRPLWAISTERRPSRTSMRRAGRRPSRARRHPSGRARPASRAVPSGWTSSSSLALQVHAVHEPLHEVERLGGRLLGCGFARCHVF